jgi:RNA polymerase-binding transcription factor DksA
MTQIGSQSALRDQLLDRRRTIELEIARVGHTADLSQLLRDVDDAFVRLENGSFGTCESCHEPIEAERLVADPLNDLTVMAIRRNGID